jgi:two-component system, chemotaxis family, response regulator Rcp1
MSQPIEVLLVEDDPGAAHLTAEALRDARVRHNVHVLTDGEAAWSYLNRVLPYANAPRPDLVLLDFNLPKLDGRELLVRIKANESLMDIPVVVITYSDNPKDVADAYRNHAACFITKPAELDQYFNAIRVLKELWYSVATLPKIRGAA